MPKPAVTVAIQAARAAARVIIRAMNRIESIPVVEKRRFDFASEVDRQAETEIIRELQRAWPDHAILAEESGARGKSRYTWVIDPLDGTHNYLRGIPHFAVSIAQLDGDEPVHAVVYDPLREELFTASKGDGAYLNDRRIRCSKREVLEGALLATHYATGTRQHLAAQQAMTAALLADAQSIRCSGASVLDLAWVACGRLDGLYELGLQPWDMAAGCLLVHEAGGSYGDLAGRSGLPADGNVIAANPRLATALRERIRAHAITLQR